MKGGFYIRLAKDGIMKNRKLYFPYILTCICMIMMFYIIYYLGFSADFTSVRGGDMLQSFLMLGVFVIAIFSLIFLIIRIVFDPQTEERVRPLQYSRDGEEKSCQDSRVGKYFDSDTLRCVRPPFGIVFSSWRSLPRSVFWAERRICDQGRAKAGHSNSSSLHRDFSSYHAADDILYLPASPGRDVKE